MACHNSCSRSAPLQPWLASVHPCIAQHGLHDADVRIYSWMLQHMCAAASSAACMYLVMRSSSLQRPLERRTCDTDSGVLQVGQSIAHTHPQL